MLHREGSGVFAEKMASVIGPSYTMAFFVGGALGLTKFPPTKARFVSIKPLSEVNQKSWASAAEFGIVGK